MTCVGVAAPQKKKIYHKRHDFRKVIEHKMCVFISSTAFCLKHFSFSEEWSVIWSKMYIGLQVK